MFVVYHGIPGVGSSEGFSVVVDMLEGFGKGSTKCGANGGLMQGCAAWKARKRSCSVASIDNPESAPLMRLLLLKFGPDILLCRFG